MIQELCISPDFSTTDYDDFQIGAHVGRLSNLSSSENSPMIVLMTEGDEPSVYHDFRKALYLMSVNFPKGSFIDLGSVKGGAVGITEVVDQLQQKGILSIVISRDGHLPHALLRAYSTAGRPIHLSLAESRIDYNWQRSENRPYLLDKLIPYYPQQLSRLSYLGYQSYFVDDRVLKLLRMMHFETHRLGMLRNSIAEVEPIVRDSDIFGLNISALAYTDAPAAKDVNPNGFTAAEACQIARYAALSDRISAVGFYGYSPSEDIKGLTALLLAQMVWYVIQGFQQRRNEFFLVPEELIRYEVHLSGDALPIAFFKSPKSERWWFYVAPAQNSAKLDPEGLISCSYEDYLKTCSGDVPDRILNALGRE
jgi:formiminoglutamase